MRIQSSLLFLVITFRMISCSSPQQEEAHFNKNLLRHAEYQTDSLFEKKCRPYFSDLQKAKSEIKENFRSPHAVDKPFAVELNLENFANADFVEKAYEKSQPTEVIMMDDFGPDTGSTDHLNRTLFFPNASGGAFSNAMRKSPNDKKLLQSEQDYAALEESTYKLFSCMVALLARNASFNDDVSPYSSATYSFSFATDETWVDTQVHDYDARYRHFSILIPLKDLSVSFCHEDDMHVRLHSCNGETRNFTVGSAIVYQYKDKKEEAYFRKVNKVNSADPAAACSLEESSPFVMLEYTFELSDSSATSEKSEEAGDYDWLSDRF